MAPAEGSKRRGGGQTGRRSASPSKRGRVLVSTRFERDLHEALTRLADDRQVSMNALVTDFVRRALEAEGVAVAS